MVAQEKQYITEAEYLTMEREALDKSEYLDGEIYPMAGASHKHNRVTENLSVEIGGFLKHKTCQSYSRDLRIYIPRNSLYAYPDLIITCGKEYFLDDEFDTLLNPTVLVEVLSRSTSKYDLEGKFELYREIDSLTEYVTVHSRRMKATVWQKSSEGVWSLAKETANPTDSIHIQTIGLTLPLRDIYDRVIFDEK